MFVDHNIVNASKLPIFPHGKLEAGAPEAIYPSPKAYDILSELGALHTPGSLRFAGRSTRFDSQLLIGWGAMQGAPWIVFLVDRVLLFFFSPVALLSLRIFLADVRL